MVFMVYTSDNNHGGTLFTDTPYNPNSYRPHITAKHTIKRRKTGQTCHQIARLRKNFIDF